MPAALTVTLVDAATGAPLPHVGHQGKEYAMAQPGAEYRVEAALDAPGETSRLQFKLKIDGRHVDHKKNRSPTPGGFVRVAWDGFPVGVGLANFKRFKFADAEIDDGAGGTSGSGAVAVEAGTVTVEVWRVKKGKKKGKKKAKATAAPKDSLLSKKTKGAKFFNLPSLTTSSGGAVAQHHSMSKHVYHVIEQLPLITTKIYTETLETLRLRKIPVPASVVAKYFGAAAPAPAAAAAASASAVQVKADSSSSSSSSYGSRRQKRKAAAAAAAAAKKQKAAAPLSVSAAGVVDLTA